MTIIGKSVPRLEDRALLTGTGRFAGDQNFDGQLHMRVVRSPVAHGRILSIDTQSAASAPGVFAVWVGADVADVPPINLRPGSAMQDLEKCRQHVLAQEIVRYVGEPLAVVFADDPYRAEDAAEMIWADIEELPPIVGLMDAPGEFSPGVSTEPAVFEKAYGDIDAAFTAAAHVIECELSVGRHAGVPLETRGALAIWNAAEGRLEFHAAAKIPHTNRIALAELLGLELDQLHLFEGHVGGGFGVRGEIYPDEVLVNLAALRFQRPVKWIEDRMEHLIAANHSREQTHRIRAATDEDGLILGIDDEFWFNQGAYGRTHGATVPVVSATMLPGPYKIPAYRTTGHIRLTNVTPAGTYRGPGRYETTFVREQLMDRIAAALDLDPLAVRRTNLIAADEMPYARPFEVGGKPIFYDSGDYPGSLDRFLDHIGYDAIQADMAARRAAGELAGAAVICFVELGGDGPFDDVRVEMAADGAVEVVTGVASVGQGVETVIAQICAETLGIDYAGITVTHGQTDRIARGQGARASRVTVMTGNATHKAASRVRAMLLETAAELLQSPADTLDIVDGVIGVADGPSLTVADAAREILRARGGISVAAEETFENDRATYSFGAQLAAVAVDPRTAGVTIERFAVAYDIGRAVNPMLVEGQLVGGAVQGIGGALFEEFLYDENGQPLSVTFADYLMPTAPACRSRRCACARFCQPADQDIQQFGERQRRGVGAAAGVNRVGLLRVCTEPCRQARGGVPALVEGRQAFDAQRRRQMIVGAGERHPPAIDLASGDDLVGAPLVAGDDEAAMGQAGRDPGDDVGVVAADPRHHIGQHLGHGVVHQDIVPALLLAPFPAVRRDLHRGRIGAPGRDGVAAILEQAGVVIGHGRGGPAVEAGDMFIGHHRHRLGDHHAMNHRAVSVDQRREVQHLGRKPVLEPRLQLLGQIEPLDGRETTVEQTLVDRLMLRGKRVRLGLGAGHEQQHAPFRVG